MGEDERPVITVTGSHRRSVLYGALSLDGGQLFRQYDDFDGESFFDHMKLIHKKFGRCLLFLDKATQHQTEDVLSYFERTLVPIWEPKASPEFMPLEECWHISKDDLLILLRATLLLRRVQEKDRGILQDKTLQPKHHQLSDNRPTLDDYASRYS
jgi:hypothetical protein